MDQFKQLDEMLTSAIPDDGWGDDGVLLAARVLQAFGPDDWSKLASTWSDRPELWQCLAADVLVDGDNERAIPLLVEIIRRGSGQAKIAACDSLRTLLQGRDKPLEVDPVIKLIINSLRKESSGLIAQSLGQLEGLVS